MLKARYIALITVIVVFLVVVSIFLYERAHVSFHSDANGTSVSIIGGADGPTSVFIAGKLGGEDTMTYKQISMDVAKQIFEADTDQKVTIKNVTQTSTWRLESEADVDSYVSKLKEKLLAELKENDVVNIEF